ncbi:MAG: hypothetical protein Q7V88_18040 [Actinomycetota bacterium]|nr:hypothetical protein [Actinomycetota bacterium]
MSRQYFIPGASKFATHGGRSTPCEFTAVRDGYTSDGQYYAEGQVVTSEHWLFREVPESFSPEPVPVDQRLVYEDRGPLAQAMRYFAVYCDSPFHLIRTPLAVPATDPLLNPRPRIASLYNGLQLERPVVFRNPVVDRWGGLITRYPSWLAVQPSAWRQQRSNSQVHLGWTLLLLTDPKVLEFQVDFVPDPAQPSPAFSGVVPCVGPGATATADAVAFPAMPALPELAEPGVNGPCMWTPPGPGTVTIQARITYSVTFWANGYTEPLADYVWTSPPATFATGELSAVNTND